VRLCINSSVVVSAKEALDSPSKGSLDAIKLSPSYSLFSKARGVNPIGTSLFREQFDVRMKLLSIGRYSWVRKRDGLECRGITLNQKEGDPILPIKNKSNVLQLLKDSPILNYKNVNGEIVLF